tara:strand:+ start:2212 stop:2415 length:204 start_codon:yes stop_codon:yes gene_type:complete
MRPTPSMYILPTVEYQNKRFNIKRLVREDPNENIEFWKSIIEHDVVLRKDNYLWFLTEIIDIEIITE